MRFLLAGIFHLALASALLAQANGDVESIGFGQSFRPGCWTPMVVRLTPTSGSPFNGKIAVYQDDADHDHAIFSRPISLAGNVEGGGDRTQRFWMYFIPQADLLKDGTTAQELNRHLSVYLTTADSPPKQITRLLVKDGVKSLDFWENPRAAQKLVLCVTDQSRPILSPYAENRGTLGLKETVEPVIIPVGLIRSQLPENVLGYEAVDAIAWFDADPGQLSSEQKAALEEYIRRGGKLIVSQTARPNIWQMVKTGFASWLPVEVLSIEQEPDVPALKRIVAARAAQGINSRNLPQWKDIATGPFDIARAKVKPGAIVLETDSDVSGTGAPFMVRAPLGMGTVTWIAQDLGDLNLTGRGSIAGTAAANEDYKWLYIWDRAFDWGNASQPNFNKDGLLSPYNTEFNNGSNDVYHFGRGFLAGMEFPGRGVAYLGLAVLFFIIYWIAAGPGSYLILAAKKRAGSSWFIFALAALIATGVTIIIVKLLLQGPAEVRHASFVRQMPGEPTRVYSQFGLYIPRDDDQRVALKNTAKDSVSYVTAYPSLTPSEEGAPPQDYEVPVFDARTVSFPYRSTLKKLQAKWVGDMPMGIEGAAKISAAQNSNLDGKLVNTSGRKLNNIYFAFRPKLDAAGREDVFQDVILYMPTWDKDATLDIGVLFTSVRTIVGVGGTPGSGVAVKGYLTRPGGVNNYWDGYWYHSLARDTNYDDHAAAPLNFPMLSLFDHLPASGFELNQTARWELHRPLLRDLDVSGSVGAGQLVILAESEPGPLPIPITVEGDTIQGEGITYYQFILPLDRSAMIKPVTQPATKPTKNTNAELRTQNSESKPAALILRYSEESGGPVSRKSQIVRSTSG